MLIIAIVVRIWKARIKNLFIERENKSQISKKKSEKYLLIMQLPYQVLNRIVILQISKHEHIISSNSIHVFILEKRSSMSFAIKM